MKNNSVGVDIQATEGDIISTLFNAQYSKVDIEQNENATNSGFDSDNISSSLQLQNGDETNILFWRGNVNYQNTKRDNESYGDFESINSSLNIDAMLTNWVGLRLSAASEKYDTSSVTSAFYKDSIRIP